MLRLSRKGVAVALALCVFGAVIGVLVKQLLDEISELTTARVDSSQWTLSQLEVELLKFKLSLQQAADPSELDEVRTRFDLFYSRVATVDKGYVRETLREDSEGTGHLDRTRAFLENAIPIIDSDDEALMAALPRLSAMVDAVRPDVRGLSLRGIAVFGAQSDTRRESLLTVMQRIAILTAALSAALLYLLIRLQRALHASESRGRELRQTTERLSTTVSSSLDAVLVMNAEGRIIEFNGAAENIFLVPRQEAIGQPMHELIVPPEYREAHLAGVDRFLKTGEKRIIGAGRIQLEAVRGNGERFPIEFSVSTASDNRGPIFISFIRDISEQVAAQNELLDARDNALAAENEKSRFIAVMSHEMRTPLNGIMGTLELLQHTDLDEKQRTLLRSTRSSSELLLEHVNDVLDISRLEVDAVVMNREPYRPRDLLQDVRDAMAAAARDKDNRIDLEIGNDVPDSLIGDRQRIRQVLVNLVSNAIKATRGGRITLAAERAEPGDGGQSIAFRVADQGIGIAAEDLERVFGEFVTLDNNYNRENEGTGLGLSISRRLVNLMGGDMTVQSSPGEGSVFGFTIPLVAATAETESEPAPTSTPVASGARRRILLVEDNATNQLVASEMLKRLGHGVDIAGNGVEGVAAARDNDYDLVLMDISMPQMDGIAATRGIRELAGSRGAVPIVAMTAHALPSERENFFAAGMNDCLVKPVRESSLRQVVETLGASGPGVADEDLSDSVEPDGADTPPDPELLDEGTLLELIELVGEDRFLRLLDDFLAETEASLPRLHQQLAGGELADLKTLSHRLAGASATFGALSLRQILVAMETAAGAGDLEGTGRLLARLEPAFERSRAEIRSILEME